MSDDEHGSLAAHAVTRVADLLVRARILPVNELQTLRVPKEEDDASASVVSVLCTLLPERVVNRDMIEVADETTYVELVRAFAAVTSDAWRPEGLRSTLAPFDDEAMVEFNQDGQHVLWRFNQPTQGISPDFGRLVNSFTIATLGGAFVTLPSEDGHTLAIYLPEPAASELTAILFELAGGVVTEIPESTHFVDFGDSSADIAGVSTTQMSILKPSE